MRVREHIKDIESFEGVIPFGSDLVIFERDEPTSSGLVLYGFDEVGLFDHNFRNPQYCFESHTDIKKWKKDLTLIWVYEIIYL